MKFTSKILIIIAINFLLSDNIYLKTVKSEYQYDQERLKGTAARCRGRIRAVSDTQPYDYLNLLPSFSLAQRSQITMMPDSETYFSITINTNQIFSVTDRAVARSRMKMKAYNKISGLEFKIQKLLNQKWLIKNQLYQLYQIRKTMSNPVEIVSIDEKIFKMRMSLESQLITIEAAYSEMNSICIEIERS